MDFPPLGLAPQCSFACVRGHARGVAAAGTARNPSWLRVPEVQDTFGSTEMSLMYAKSGGVASSITPDTPLANTRRKFRIDARGSPFGSVRDEPA